MDSLLTLIFFFFAGAYGELKNGHYYEGKSNVGSVNDFFQFRTRPDLLAPRWNITKHDKKALAPGYLFVAPYKKLDITERGEAWIGPHIYDMDGELIWSGAPLFDHFKAFDIRLANVSGTEMLTAMYPHENSAAIINKHYEIVKKVVHSSSWEYSNMHDFNVVQDGTRALVLTKDSAVQLSKARSKTVGFDGKCLVRGDGLKYLDITTAPPQILMTWNGTDHIGLDETVMHEDSKPIDVLCTDDALWDIHHLNSIDIFPDGDFLISSRATSTLFKISHKSGEIVWRIGGLKSDFELPIEARFNFQHHARVHSQNKTHIVMSLMDNSRKPAESDEYTARLYSAGLILSLDTKTMKGQLLGEYPHPYGGKINKRGSAHVMPSGHVLMGWADNILVSEYAPDGRLLMEGNILPKLDSYRSYKFEWVGEPLEPPTVYSAGFLSGNTTYSMFSVSWNGATEVATWKFYELDRDTGPKRLLNKAPRTGFETSLTHRGYVEYVVAEALDVHGRLIGQSNPIRTIPVIGQELGMPVDHTIVESADKTTESVGLNVPSSNPKPSAINHLKAAPSQTNALSETEETSWTATLQSNQIVAFASALSGFVACAALCAIVWALRNFRSKQWWRHQDTRYEALPPTMEDDGEDEGNLGVDNHNEK